MYDATPLEILSDYGFGKSRLPHAVVTERGKTDRKQFHEKALPARWEFFKKNSKTGGFPCITSIGATELVHPDFLIEIEATAVFD
jgi:enamine deaminase RidA (YjgF/YER057c/UK114 family)